MGLCLEWQDITFEDTSTCFRLFSYQWYLWLSIHLFSQVWNHRKLPCCKTQAFSSSLPDSNQLRNSGTNLCWQSSPLWGSQCMRPFPPAWPRVIKLSPSSTSSQKTHQPPTPSPIIANQDESGLLWTTAATAGMINVPLNPKKMSWPQGRKKETVPQSKYKLTSAGSDPVLLIRTTTFPLWDHSHHVTVICLFCLPPPRQHGLICCNGLLLNSLGGPQLVFLSLFMFCM